MKGVIVLLILIFSLYAPVELTRLIVLTDDRVAFVRPWFWKWEILAIWLGYILGIILAYCLGRRV